METMGFKSPKQLTTVRTAAVNAGWLVYDRQHDRSVGKYFVIIPPQFAGLDDSPINEIPVPNTESIPKSESVPNTEHKPEHKPESIPISEHERQTSRNTNDRLSGMPSNPNPNPNPFLVVRETTVSRLENDQETTASRSTIDLQTNFVAADPDPPAKKITPQEVFAFIQSIPGISTPIKLSKDRMAKIKSRLVDPEWFPVLQKCAGMLPLGNGDGWQPDIDYLIANEGNVHRIIEGKFNWRSSTGKSNNTPQKSIYRDLTEASA